ncbi:hypothetical protein Luke3_00029 [Pseudomonas phage vB_PpuP-Luke-3]
MGSGKKVFKTVADVGSLGMNKLVPGGWAAPVENALAGNASPLDGFTGAATARAAETQAKASRDAAEQQAAAQREQTEAINQQTKNAASSAAQQASLDAANKAAQAQAAATQNTNVETTPTVDLSLGATNSDDSAARRKRYQSGAASVNTGSGGSSVRL